AKEDRKRFPEILQAGTDEQPYYTNSSQLPVGFTDDPFEALSRQEELQRIDAAVTRGQSLAHVETVRRHKDGHLLDVSLTFSPIVDAAGVRIGISTIARDIGERKRVEQLLQRQTALTHLLQVVAVAANQATSVREALQITIDAVCAEIGWPVGHVYLAEEGESEPLHPSDIWHLDEPERFKAFVAITEALPTSTPDDLPARVLVRGQPEWIADLAVHPTQPRFSLISNLGVRCGFAFPVLVGAEVAAVLEFFAAEPQTPDAALLEVMANVGTELGRAIERDRADQALRRSEQMYRTLARNLPNGSVLLFDRQLRFTFADGTALADVGLSREAVEGRTLHEVLSPAAVARLEPIYEATLSGAHTELEIEVAGYVYHSHFLPVQDGHGAVIAGMAMSYDITELKRVERELREEREQLACRVAERTEELSLANAELARAARLKDEFMATMSHELRTPLNAILGLAEILQESIYGPVVAKQAEALRGIEESGRHLLSLINDILDLSKIEAGRLELEVEPIEINLLCQASLRMVSQLALMKRIALTSNADSTSLLILGDTRRLKQILVNLLTNAVKFTPEGGKVGLEVRADAEQQSLTFTVWDTGIGIAAEHLAKLFKPFVQIDSSLSRQHIGTGLGLALVLRLAEAHGGSVAVESAEGQGSRFSVTLPWSQPAQLDVCLAALIPSPLARPQDQQRHVLLAEDSQANIAVLLDYLQTKGYTVTVARNGHEALAAAQAEPVALILMDVQMPGMDGLEVMRRLRAEEATRAVPIIALTALAMPGDRERCLAAGATSYLTKPVGLQTLLATIATALEQEKA
ncbi:MAG: response regulator, partial [Chloroflexales bacterium]|nr:response regulator [Chloroflexales bacterium]